MSQEISFKQINKIAIPSMFIGIVEPIIGLIDSAIVGNMPENSTEALGAVSLGTQLFMLLFWIFIQTETSLSAIIANALGKNKVKSTEGLITQGLLLNIVIGLSLWLGSNLFLQSIFDLYQAKGLVKEMATEYYQVRSIGFPIMLCTGMIWGVFRGLQNTSWAMVIGIIGGVTNLILDYTFIYGVGDIIQPMGVVGAAYGSLGAQSIMLVLTLFYFFRKTDLKFTWLGKFHPDFKLLMKSGSDFMIRGIALNLVIFLSYSFATGYGDGELAAHGVAMQFWLLSAFLLDGYANAGQAISGKLSGTYQWENVRLLKNRLSKVSIIISLLIMGIYFLGMGLISEHYFKEIYVRDIFITIMYYVIIFQIVNGLAFTYDGIIKGILASKFIRNLMILAGVGFTIALFSLDYMDYGIHAIWISLSFWMIIRVVGAHLFLNSRLKTESK